MSHIEPLNGSKTNERHTSLESSHILLYDLLKRNAPSAHWIRGLFASHFVDDLLLTDLPDPSVSVAQYSGAAVQALARHHIINDSFLSYLGRELPHEQNIINDIRRLLSLPMRIEEIVSFDVLMDNWAYEDVAELYADGPKDDVVGFLSVGEEELSWRREGWTGVALESLPRGAERDCASRSILRGGALHRRMAQRGLAYPRPPCGGRIMPISRTRRTLEDPLAPLPRSFPYARAQEVASEKFTGDAGDGHIIERVRGSSDLGGRRLSRTQRRHWRDLHGASDAETFFGADSFCRFTPRRGDSDSRYA
jgi:hypothetical protein